MSEVDLKNVENLNKFQKFFYDYARYHRNFVNVLIHIVCIPIITLTYFKIFEILEKEFFHLGFNPFYIVYGIWVPIYIYTDVLTGLITSIFYPLLDCATQACLPELFGENYNMAIVWLHLGAWFIQFIGHGFFEKRKPALSDNLMLMFNAPVFVVIEIMVCLFRYRKDEIKEATLYADAEIAEFRKSKTS